MAQSRNIPAVKVLASYGVDKMVTEGQKMGITTPLPAVPSLAIGVGEVKEIELVSAFTTFPNKGIHIPYRMIDKIVDRYGRVIENNTAIRKDEVLSAQTAYIMVDIMKSVVDAGTAQRARWMGFTRPAGGKTGTSDNYCDNWFVGYTPQITTGVWVGFDDKTSLGEAEDGARNAVPIWTEFMLAACSGLPVEEFEEPEGIAHADVCSESGELATDRCPEVRPEVFKQGTEPTADCHLHPSRSGYHPANRTRPGNPADSTEERRHF